MNGVLSEQSKTVEQKSFDTMLMLAKSRLHEPTGVTVTVNPAREKEFSALDLHGASLKTHSAIIYRQIWFTSP